ncbi:hypothetical protein BpHYR1_001827 [Brachionus plicatilis]|uniref:Uncharacterized protein n=1 Tax=Brachionus plicatilis TaxID=10195 RepID=A0A3M7SKQ0_BRAPC|nr:hypothetical protein BpHYR1_001827 [Brachionus plicatilis]
MNLYLFQKVNKEKLFFISFPLNLHRALKSIEYCYFLDFFHLKFWSTIMSNRYCNKRDRYDDKPKIKNDIDSTPDKFDPKEYNLEIEPTEPFQSIEPIEIIEAIESRSGQIRPNKQN